MRFSLTGNQADAALLVESIGRSEDHSLGACHIRGDLEVRLQSLPAGSRRVSSAEEALVDSGVDTVIVAESNAEESVQLARQASQADCHVVVVPPDDVSTAYSYELHLLLDESQRGVAVLSGSWYLPDDRPVNSDVADCQVGLPAVADDPDPAATLLHAVDACAALGFANSQVTVLGADDAAVTRSSQQIVLSGASADGTTAPGVTLNRSSLATSFKLQGHTAGQTIHQTLIVPGHTSELTVECSRALCQRLAQRLPDDSACQARMEQYSRTLQVAEAVAKSIRRRRTVDVYGDELSERSVFKTQMTAMGCGVLTWMMFGMIGYLLIGQLFHPPTAVMQVMRALWIAPVVVFLMAQFLLPLARGRQHTASQPHTDSTDETDAQDAAPHSR